MTSETYRERLLHVERYAARVGFLCPLECKRDWYAHAEDLISNVAERLNAEYYGFTRPPITTECDHLVIDIERHLAWFEDAWSPRD